SIGLVHDQALVWARGFGWASVERKAAAAPETLYRIASITKLFTATAILQLRDAGKLGLDEPLAAHLPWFGLKGAEPGAPPITIRPLLTPPAGLPREAGFPYWTDGRFPAPADLRARLPDQAPVLPVETRWKYSNLALTLAGEVVAAVSGEPWATCIQRRVLQPPWTGAPPPPTPPPRP